VALQLFRLASEKFPAISATTSQRARAYFTTMTAAVTIAAGSHYTRVASKWLTSTGGQLTGFSTGQGLNLLSINAVLQQPGLYTVNATKVVILGAPGTGTPILSNYPLTLQTYNANAAVVVSATRSRVAIP
jgi:hypothetical protein